MSVESPIHKLLMSWCPNKGSANIVILDELERLGLHVAKQAVCDYTSC